MSKIGDLFIKLGLKKEDFDKGINDAEKQVKGFSVSTKAMSAAASAAWAAVAAAVVKFAKDAVKMTQTWGDAWNVTMAGVKGAYGAFVRQLSSGEGFDNLFANMREAARVAREVAAALDEVFDRTISSNYETAQIDNEIADWQKAMRDMSKTEEERIAAANKVNELTAKRYAILKDIQKQEGEAYRAAFQSQTGLNDEQTDFLVKEYNANRQLINQARQYREERQKAYGAAVQKNKTGNVGGVDWTGVNDAMKAFDAQYSDSVKTVAAWTKLYDKGNDELVANMAKAEVAVISLDTQAKHATDRADLLVSRLSKADSGGGKASGKSAMEQQAEQAAALAKQVEEAGKSELQKESEKYAASLALMKQYGYDTEQLTKQHFERLSEIIGEGKTTIEAVEIDFDWGFKDDFEEIDEELTMMTEGLLEKFNRIQEAAAEFGDAISGGFKDACEELMNQLVGLEDFNAGAVVKALLEPLADMAEKAGAIIMAEGLATIAAKSALETFGATGWGAVAAGAALIAAGVAAKAGLAALAKSGATPAAASGYSGSGTGGGVSNTSLETEMTIYVEGRISGEDIVLSGQKTLKNWSR